MGEEARKSIAGLLYDGILSAQDWYEGLDAIRATLGAGVFDYLTVSTAESHVLDSVDNQGDVGLYADKLLEYKNHYMGRDLRMAVLARMPVGRVMLDHEHISAREMSRNEVYADFLRVHGFQHTLAALVRDDPDSRDYLGFLRSVDHAPYGAGERALMGRVMPHLRRAATLRARAGQLGRQAALGLAALDTLPQALAVVDAQCRIQYTNPAAGRLLEGFSALHVRHGRLQCGDAQAHAQFAQHVARACGCEGVRTAGAQSLAGNDRRLVVTMLPLKASHAASAHWQVPLALVILTDPAGVTGLRPELVGEILGLSPAEVRLALLLTSGKTVKDFAVLQGCTVNTARTHLTSLMHKTGCHRQVELTGLLQSLRLG